MQGGSVLVVEDDKKIVTTIKLYLEHGGFHVRVAHTGRRALEEVLAKEPDLIILDLMLPQIDGMEVCRTLRAQSEIPIIMLTARATEEDKLRGLDLGADDYVTKPFSPRELVARVRTVLRRRASQVRERGPAQLTFGDLVVDIERHEIKVRGEAVAVTPNEFRLLETLIQFPERAFTRKELVERAFGWDYDGLERTVDAHIMNLRRKIEANRSGESPFIVTVYGLGYKFSHEGQTA
jgi:DNA-binding response OmpR family regulator